MGAIKAMNLAIVKDIQPLTTSTIQQRCMYGTQQNKMMPTFGMLFGNVFVVQFAPQIGMLLPRIEGFF